MDENAANYDDNATAEALGDCLYMASMDQFMEAMDEKMSIDDMLNQTPRAGYSTITSMNQFSEDLNQQMDIHMEEHVMVDLANNSAMVRTVLSVDSMMTADYQVIQVGEVVNIHATTSGMVIEGSETVNVQTRDSAGSIMDMVHSVLSNSPMAEDSDNDDDDDDSGMPEDMSTSFSYDSKEGSQTMQVTFTENGSSVSIQINLDENEELMSYQLDSSDGTNTTSIMYAVMWGDAVVIEVDTTLPKTSIPIWFVEEEYEPEMACGNVYGGYFSDDVNEDSCNSWMYLEDYDSPNSDEPFTGCYNSYTHVQLEGMSEIECDSYTWSELHQDEPDDDQDDGDDGSDESDDGNHISWDSYHDGYCEWEGYSDATDAGEDSRWWCKISQDDEDWENWWYYCEFHDQADWYCTDDFGQSEEFEHSADGDEAGELDDDDEMVCYDQDSHLIDEAYDNQVDCEDAGLIWTAEVAELEDDNDDNDDLGYQSGTVADNMTYTAPISDFELRFLDCDGVDSDDLNDCTVMASGSLASGIANSSDGFLQMTFIYDDIDADGMISAGDTLSLNDTMGLHVGIYDLWAYEYTDESKAIGPSLPGFGSLLATISLLGAAFLLPRRDD